MQYFSRFLAWYLYRTNHPTTSIAPFENLKKQFSSVRKALRIGKFIEHLKAAAVASDSKALDPVLKYLAVGRQLGYAAYLSLDSVCYLESIGATKLSSDAGKRLQVQAYKAWWVGLVCNVVAGGYTLWGLQRVRERVEGSADAEKKVEEKKLER